MKIDTNLKYLPSEDLFSEIYDLHVGRPAAQQRGLAVKKRSRREYINEYCNSHFEMDQDLDW